jgi:hypothetical protein
MMLRVLVLAGARQECPCCDVMVSRFCGLVPVGVFRFHYVFGFCKCFLFFLYFFLFWCSFYIFHVCLGAPLRFFVYFSTYLSKKKNILTLFFYK